MPNSPTKGADALTTFDWPRYPDPNDPNQDPNIPHGAQVVLGFHGLLCFCHRHRHSDKNCEIGVHNLAFDHNLTITVYRVSPNFDPPYQMHTGITSKATPFAGPFTFGDTGNTKGDKVTFEVHGPAFPDVRYFQNPNGGLRYDPKNFTLILDLESDDFYGKGVELKKQLDHMGPRIRVSNALFYTLCPSTTEFKRKVVVGPPANDLAIGRIARMVGANIYLEDGGSVKIKMKGNRVVELKPTESYKFFVFVSNGCADPRVNDFPLYRDTFTPPLGNPVEFDLEKIPLAAGNPAPAPDTPPPDTPCDLFLPESKSPLVSTDDAPCGAMGFGSSGGMP
jgi:hypothetical protein